MSDGHLNICKTCKTIYATQYRKLNPNTRKEERERSRKRTGKPTRAEWLAQNKLTNLGRKVTATKYSHKRRMQILERAGNILELDEFVLEEAIDLAQKRKEHTGFKWSVDHIVPINHKKASGLHTAFNLQVVPARWNSWKGNRNMIELPLGILT